MTEASDMPGGEPDGNQRTAADVPLPGGEFRLFITRLAYQLMMSCGLLENPVTRTKQVNGDNARMLLADLSMIREKTVGNLDEDEEAHIDKVLNDLGPIVQKLGRV